MVFPPEVLYNATGWNFLQLLQTQVASKFEWGNYENCESSVEAVEFVTKTKMMISLAK